MLLQIEQIDLTLSSLSVFLDYTSENALCFLLRSDACGSYMPLYVVLPNLFFQNRYPKKATIINTSNNEITINATTQPESPELILSISYYLGFVITYPPSPTHVKDSVFHFPLEHSQINFPSC